MSETEPGARPIKSSSSSCSRDITILASSGLTRKAAAAAGPPLGFGGFGIFGDRSIAIFRKQQQRLQRAMIMDDDDDDDDEDAGSAMLSRSKRTRLDAVQSSGEIIGDEVQNYSSNRLYPTLYLLGRYRKLARDVPQSPWMINGKKKGRNSVSEIIEHAVKAVLKCKECKLHACGREDIDVRCLGNGRPFVLEVLGVSVEPTGGTLVEIVQSLQRREGLNNEGDVDVLLLKEADKRTWESMQAVAEEKKKAYVCVCWSEEKVSAADLAKLEALCTGGSVDNDGDPCLHLLQKTPLRVAHRRSLLDRTRFVYDIQTCRISDHYFLLSLVTSAGLYVKEFVHGDLGRTVPSVQVGRIGSSILTPSLSMSFN